jgi:hypothetical protein
VFAGSFALRHYLSVLAAAKLLRLGKSFCGRPFLGASFRAFTASPNAEKGTPTAQPFDNRSIA